MTINELRIGNLIKDKHGAIHVIDKNHFQVLEGLIRDGIALPIEINEEWLVRLGFEKEERGKPEDFDGVESVFHLEGVDIYDHIECGGSWAYATYTRYPGRGFKGGITVAYVHSLMNLYFTLTGKELIYTP